MADEQKETKEGTKEEKLSFKNADELSTFLMDLQGKMGALQETIDKMGSDDKGGNDEKEEKEDTEIEVTDEEINEIDQLLQSE